MEPGLSVSLGSILATVIPTMVMGFLSFFAKTTLDDIKTSVVAVAEAVKALDAKVDGHQTALSVMDERVLTLKAANVALELRVAAREAICREVSEGAGVARRRR